MLSIRAFNYSNFLVMYTWFELAGIQRFVVPYIPAKDIPANEVVPGHWVVLDKVHNIDNV